YLRRPRSAPPGCGGPSDGATRRAARPGERSVVAELPERGLVVGPVVAHLAPELQEDLALEQPLHLDPRRGTDALQGLATPADDDGLLARPLHPDHGADPAQLTLLLEGLDLHRAGIGQLLPQL